MKRAALLRSFVSAPRTAFACSASAFSPGGVRAAALLLIGLLSGCAGQSAQPDKTAAVSGEPDLRILHVNDTHSYVAGANRHGNYCVDDAECRGGYARIAAAIKAAKAEHDNVLALHAGDTFQGTLFFSVHRWPMPAELDALIPYDASTLGNHEFDDGCVELTGYLDRQNGFPVLAANVTGIEEGPLAGAKLKPFIIREIRGRKVGVIGIGNIGGAIPAASCPGLRVPDHTQVLKDAVAELEKQGVHRIVALTHLGLSEDRRLAREVEGLDVIVGGHSHSFLGEGSEEGPYPIVERGPSGKPVLVVTAGFATRHLGELSVSFDDKGVPVQWSGAARELSADLPRDETVAQAAAKYAGALDSLRKKVVGSHRVRMNDGLDGCRKAECFGGLLITDAMLDHGRRWGARIALVNSGDMRAALAPGAITQGDILNVFPFAGRILLKEYTGAQILEALEHGVKGRDNGEGPGRVGGTRMLQAAGLRYEVDEGRPAGGRVVKAEVFTPAAQGGKGGKGGKAAKERAEPLDPEKSYIVALPEYIAKGGGGFEVLTRGRDVESARPIDSDMVIDYVSRHSPIEVRPGRLIIHRK